MILPSGETSDSTALPLKSTRAMTVSLSGSQRWTFSWSWKPVLVRKILPSGVTLTPLGCEPASEPPHIRQ
jgi:hypothetical protein